MRQTQPNLARLMCGEPPEATVSWVYRAAKGIRMHLGHAQYLPVAPPMLALLAGALALPSGRRWANGTSVYWHPSPFCHPESLPQSSMVPRLRISRSPVSLKHCPIHGPNRSGELGSICRARELWRNGLTRSRVKPAQITVLPLEAADSCAMRAPDARIRQRENGGRTAMRFSLRELALDNELAAAVGPAPASRPLTGVPRTGLW